ncbi:MAG TPA: hypothetical protein VFJ57_06920 [Solirubrobacterales bacterium]|nr:hypothetical protein [Solirubrobacterales bacterium]
MSTADAEDATGALPDLIAYVARYLSEFGAALMPGEIVISRSTLPLIDIPPKQRLALEGRRRRCRRSRAELGR